MNRTWKNHKRVFDTQLINASYVETQRNGKLKWEAYNKLVILMMMEAERTHFQHSVCQPQIKHEAQSSLRCAGENLCSSLTFQLFSGHRYVLTL